MYLPEENDDFSMYRRLIRPAFAKRLPATEWHSTVRQRRNEALKTDTVREQLAAFRAVLIDERQQPIQRELELHTPV